MVINSRTDSLCKVCANHWSGRGGAGRGEMSEQTTEIRDGMRIDWDAPIAMDDGLVLRADIYRPVENGRYPVIMSYGPYGKGLHFEDLYTDQWNRMVESHPDVTTGSTNKYQNWEVVDPEKWVPDGYVVVRIDSRGAGRSPGLLDLWSAREAKDFYDCIEWAAEQPWSNGRIGLNGISYYAMNQWQVAALQPPHLAAMCIWEGAADFYRDLSHHGGILCTFGRIWFPSQVMSVQHGRGTRGYRSLVGVKLGPVLEAMDLEPLLFRRRTNETLKVATQVEALPAPIGGREQGYGNFGPIGHARLPIVGIVERIIVAVVVKVPAIGAKLLLAQRCRA